MRTWSHARMPPWHLSSSADKERRRTQAELTIFNMYAQFYRHDFERVRELVLDEEQRLTDADP